MCSSTRRAPRPICCAGMAAVRGASGSATTRPADTGRRIPSSRPDASRGLQAPTVFDGPSTTPPSWPTSSKCSCRRSGRATSWCSTISPSTNNPRSRPRSNGRGAAPLPPPVQPGLQSDRTRVCEAESLHARRAPAQLRPGRRAHGDRASGSSHRPQCPTSFDTAAIASLRRYEKRSSGMCGRFPLGPFRRKGPELLPEPAAGRYRNRRVRSA